MNSSIGSEQYNKAARTSKVKLEPTCDFCGKIQNSSANLTPIYKARGKYSIGKPFVKESKENKILPAFVACPECIEEMRDN